MNSSEHRATADIGGNAGPHGELPGEVYGRRIEADRSWTVYHAFTGVPVVVDGGAMVGLALQTATERMIALNRVAHRRRHLGHRKLRLPLRCNAGEIGVF